MSSFPPRFEKLVRRPDDDGCWIWTGHVRSRYGEFFWKGRRRSAHRFAWQVANDALIPDGMCVLHRCDNTRCVRPDHLFLGTHVDNMRDMRMKGRARAPRGPRKSVCCRNHPLAGENLLFARDGKRRCRACMRAAQRLYHANRRRISVKVAERLVANVSN